MKLHGYKPPPLPSFPRKPSKLIKDADIPTTPEPDRSLVLDPGTYDFKGSRRRLAARLFLGVALATGVALAVELWRKQAIHACAGPCGHAGRPLHVSPTKKGTFPPGPGSPAVPSK